MQNWASKYVGIQYVSMGDTRQGCNCYGLVRLVLREQFGKAVPAVDLRYERGREADLAQAVREYDESAAQWATISAGQEQPGDVVMLRLRGHPIHLGVVTRPGWMLHVERGTATCEERYTSPRWLPRVVGFRRWMGG